MRRRAQNIPTAEPAEEGEHSFQGEVPPEPPRSRRGRSRPRMAPAQEIEQEPATETPQVDPVVFSAGMTGINQGLVAMNQAMPLVQQML